MDRKTSQKKGSYHDAKKLLCGAHRQRIAPGATVGCNNFAFLSQASAMSNMFGVACGKCEVCAKDVWPLEKVTFKIQKEEKVKYIT